MSVKEIRRTESTLSSNGSNPGGAPTKGLFYSQNVCVCTRAYNGEGNYREETR